MTDFSQPPSPSPGSDSEAAARPSKSQRKREMIARQKLGERLVTLAPEQIDRMALPEALKKAVLSACRGRCGSGRPGVGISLGRRQLLRNAGKGGDAGKTARSSKQLFRYIMALLAEAPEAGR